MTSNNNDFPLIFKFNKLENNNILDYKDKIFLSSSLDYPCFIYGFTHFIHATKDKTKVFKMFENKKKIFYIVSKYERFIDNYNDSIGGVSGIYFKDKPKILTRAFYKMWEILMLFEDIIDINNDNFTSASICEGPGSFIQSIIYYRELYCKNWKNDKYYGLTIYSKENDGGESTMMSDIYDKVYGIEKPKRVFIHKVYPLSECNGDKDNGDITNIKTLENFKKDIKGKVDLVTADGGFEWGEENIQEQEAFKLILGEIITALNIIKKGGTFICKLFETYTNTSLKLIILIMFFFEEVYFIKPLMSRLSNSERYIVCLKYKYENNKYLTDLNKILTKINDSKKINKIFPDYIIPRSMRDDIVYFNTIISNRQMKIINNMIKFIDSNEYYGTSYHKYLKEQKEGSKIWVDLFLNKNTREKISNDLKKLFKNEIDINKKDRDDLSKRLNYFYFDKI